jgi:hypothetical protein
MSTNFDEATNVFDNVDVGMRAVSVMHFDALGVLIPP